MLVLFFLLPLPPGWIQHNLLRKISSGSGLRGTLGGMEDRLVAELSLDDQQGYPVVLANFPKGSRLLISSEPCRSIYAEASPEEEAERPPHPEPGAHETAGRARSSSRSESGDSYEAGNLSDGE